MYGAARFRYPDFKTRDSRNRDVTRHASIPTNASIPTTVGELLVVSAHRTPDNEAIASGSDRLTYQALLNRANGLAAGLGTLGLTKGDRVGVHLHNCTEAYETILACSRSGLLFVPLNHMLNGSELATIITHAGLGAVVGEAALAPVLGNALSILKSPVEHIIGVDDFPSASVYYADLLARDSQGLSQPVSENDVFALMYTSGTTGLPKGVVLTHKNVVTHARHMVRDYGYAPTSVGLVALPYFVGASLNGVGLPTLLQGGRVIIQRAFTPNAFLDLVESEAVTHVQTVPTLLSRLMDTGLVTPERIRSLQVLGYGSAPMPRTRLKEAVDLFGPILYQMYGLTETCAMATCLRPADHVAEGVGQDRLASCGRPVEGIDVRIINSEGGDVPPGEPGEVIIKGPTVMAGYWNSPDLTASALVDGWFHSGDLACADDEGYIYLTDRMKDVIITGGFNVSPREVEEVLFTHPGVVDCAVIGVPDDDWGEAVCAYVLIRPGDATQESDLMTYTRDRLSAFKRPKSIIRIDEIPRNPSGKVLKRELRERAGGEKGIA